MDDTDIPMAIARREYCSQRAACDEPPGHLDRLWSDLPYEHRDHLRAFVLAGIQHATGGSDA